MCHLSASECVAIPEGISGQLQLHIDSSFPLEMTDVSLSTAIDKLCRLLPVSVIVPEGISGHLQLDCHLSLPL